MKISVIGLGYVGTALSVLLAEDNEVMAIDIDENKVNEINKRKPTIKDSLINHYMKKVSLNLNASTNYDDIAESSFVIIATPTNFSEEKNAFDTSSVLSCINKIKLISKDIPIVIKSTVPVGFTEKLNADFNCDNIIFSPEFLREGSAIHDNLYPDRIVIGSKSHLGKAFSKIIIGICNVENPIVIFTNSSEAEAIKLFSNAYLAMRVAFFNELDNLALNNGLSSFDLIKGISADKRIGNHYNNPSFGYGGYCLPKDTKQLRANFFGVPHNLIDSIIQSNANRIAYISDYILARNNEHVGIYRLVMKEGSDNFNTSSIIEVLCYLKKKLNNIYIYEPLLKSETFMGCQVIKDLEVFKRESQLIVANRFSNDLINVKNKLFTRDLFKKN